MNLPKVITNLVEAQNNFESASYADCFSKTAVVFDEGKTHNGRIEIERWIADANQKYAATMTPISFEQNKTENLLKVKVSGNFEGSPLVLSYHLEIADDLIQSLMITG